MVVVVVGKRRGGWGREGRLAKENQGTGSEGTQITICMSLPVGIISRKEENKKIYYLLQSRLTQLSRRLSCSGKTWLLWPPPPSMIRPGRAERDPHLRSAHAPRTYVHVYKHTYIHAYMHTDILTQKN